jgi:integrase
MSIGSPFTKHRIRDRSQVRFVPRDLRRTAASHMTGMGIGRLVVSKLLNHVERGVTAVYDRHSYDREKRAALEVWGAQLERIIGAYGGVLGNVIAL